MTPEQKHEQICGCAAPIEGTCDILDAFRALEQVTAERKINVEETEWIRIKFGFTEHGQPTLRGPESASPKDRDLFNRWMEEVNRYGVGDFNWLP